MLNVNWYIGLLRTMTLLYGEIPVPEKLFEFMQSNRFELLVDAESVIGGEGKTMTAKMTGKNIFRAIPDKDCKLRWFLSEPDPKLMQFTLEKVELKIGASASYIGTYEWQAPPAEILLGFCDKPARDTVLIQMFQPKGKELWVIDEQTTPGKFVTGIIFNCFMDEKRVKEAAANTAKYQKMQEEMMAEYKNAIEGNEYLLAMDPSKMTKEEREKMQKIVTATKSIQNKLTVSAVANNIIFNEPLKNNLKTVFENEVDGRVLFPSNTKIQYAKFKVEIRHVE